MCSGTALLYEIPRIVAGENRTFQGPEQYVRSRGVQLTLLAVGFCLVRVGRIMELHSA